MSDGVDDETVQFEEAAVRDYLDRCIRHWRDREDPFADYYVDAFQSVRVSLFGELLPEDD